MWLLSDSWCSTRKTKSRRTCRFFFFVQRVSMCFTGQPSLPTAQVRAASIKNCLQCSLLDGRSVFEPRTQGCEITHSHVPVKVISFFITVFCLSDPPPPSRPFLLPGITHNFSIYISNIKSILMRSLTIKMCAHTHNIGCACARHTCNRPPFVAFITATRWTNWSRTSSSDRYLWPRRLTGRTKLTIDRALVSESVSIHVTWWLSPQLTTCLLHIVSNSIYTKA